MKLPTRLKYIHSIINKTTVHGIDICGEIPLSPHQLFLPKYHEAIAKNETANTQILETIFQTPKQYSHTW